MRVNVRFRMESSIKLPINQNYFLSSAIYNILAIRPDFAGFLHDRGYTHEPSGRAFKLFVFSPIMCKNRRVLGEEILLGPGQATWMISSPMPEFLTALAEGLLSRGEIEVRGTRLPIETVMAEPEPNFQPETRFVALSPIVASRPGGPGEYAHFCTHEDPDFSERVRANLRRKYELIHGCLPADDTFEMEFDPEYIARRNGKVTKLIDIRGTLIRGVQAPFTARGSVELLRVGWDSGFGERGSMGFGCVETVAQKPI